MRKMLLFIFLSSAPLFLLFADERGERHYRDSVMAKVEQLPHDTVRLSQLRDIAHTHQYPPYNVFFAKALYDESLHQKNLFYENLGAYYMAGYYDRKHDSDSLTYWVARLKEYARQNGNYEYYLERKAAISRALASKRMIEKAIFVAKETLLEAEMQKSDIGKIAAYNSLGCAYSVSSRSEQSLIALLKAYRIFTPRTLKSLKIDVLSRIAQVYGNAGNDRQRMPYLQEMDQTLQEAIAESPETRNNWTDLMIDCNVKYVLHYMDKKDFGNAGKYIERAKALLAPHVDPVFWLNIQLIQLQYFTRTKEFERSIALIDEVTPMVLKNYVSTFGTLINYKAITQSENGDLDGAIETRRYLVRAQDSLNNAFSANELEQVKEIYHINELLLEKQKIMNTNYLRIFGVLFIVSVLCLLFYIYTRSLSRKIVVAEREAANAAAHTEEDNAAKERLKMQISHDVRTPLNSVVGFSELLAESDTLDKETKISYGKIIQENAQLLLDYVNNILELSRLESGKIKYQPEEMEIIGVCKDVIGLVNQFGDNHEHVSLCTAIGERTIISDKNWFIMLLRSLVTSVKEADGNMPVKVYVDMDPCSSVLVFKVVNTPMAGEDIKDKKAVIRNEINAHFIRHFGGIYKIEAKSGEGPSIVFTCPLHVTELHFSLEPV